MSSTGWTLQHNVPLKTRNTFGVMATAPRLLTITDPSALPEALAHLDVTTHGLLPLGGGSNMLFVADPKDTVLVMANAQARIIEHRPDHALVQAGAGMAWHDLVIWSLDQGLSGLENLALIPGTVGAAPIQNIGAYGAQAGDYITAIHAWDRTTQTMVELQAADCHFGYRDSVFKHHPDRWIITAVQFRLPLLSELRTGYAGIAEEMTAQGVTLPSARDVANAVIAIRQRKLPDPAVLGNAGSFFKNPIVPLPQVEALQSQHANLPVFPGTDGDNRKISAAWLIEQSGWKGQRDGDAGVSSNHALVLVNHGNASGAELLALARRIAASVAERFGVSIEPEPRMVGAHW